jgi:hypothetical protein
MPALHPDIADEFVWPLSQSRPPGRALVTLFHAVADRHVLAYPPVSPRDFALQ